MAQAMETAKKENKAASLLASARRITVKIGSSLLIDEGGGARRDWLATLAADIAALHKQGKQVIAVSSGAVALGRARLTLKRSEPLAAKQAAAAAGQPLLMQAWQAAMDEYGIPTAQLLLTIDDTESRRRWLNARATIEMLLAGGALPVVNENDSVATAELRYGDNDRLSARVAQMVRSDLLILLSDVDGLYTADPARDPAAVHLPYVESLSPEILACAGGSASRGIGTFGCATIIAAGREAHPLGRLAEGARATVVAAAGSPGRAYKQWIRGTLAPAGSVTVDDGAARALAAGKSLLPAGVRSVEGAFERGVCLRVLGPDGREIARGLSAYSAAEAAAIAGRSSAEIEACLGFRGPDELIHRDDLVLL
jgi:glutamate 5-kinase